jgi:hypothetical protein
LPETLPGNVLRNVPGIACHFLPSIIGYCFCHSLAAQSGRQQECLPKMVGVRKPVYSAKNAQQTHTKRTPNAQQTHSKCQAANAVLNCRLLPGCLAKSQFGWQDGIRKQVVIR